MTTTSHRRTPAHPSNVVHGRPSKAGWERRMIALAAGTFLSLTAAVPVTRADVCVDQQNAVQQIRAAHRELEVDLDILLQIAKSYPEEHQDEGRQLILGAALLSEHEFAAWTGALLQICRGQASTLFGPDRSQNSD